MYLCRTCLWSHLSLSVQRHTLAHACIHPQGCVWLRLQNPLDSLSCWPPDREKQRWKALWKDSSNLINRNPIWTNFTPIWACEWGLKLFRLFLERQIVFKYVNVKIYKMSIVCLKGKSLFAIFPPCPPLLSLQVIFGIIIQLNQPHSLRRAAQLRMLHAETSLGLSYARSLWSLHKSHISPEAHKVNSKYPLRSFCKLALVRWACYIIKREMKSRQTDRQVKGLCSVCVP